MFNFFDINSVLAGDFIISGCMQTKVHDNCRYLKEKFSSGIEGALASTLNRDFNWKKYQK